jgi:2-oxo-3-hexenedioate decarboxylase
MIITDDNRPITDEIAREVLTALDERQQIAPLTKRYGDISLSEAYGITAAVRRLREARGEHVVGRKIGFTNQTIWPEYGVHAPIWGYVYDATLHRLADLTRAFDLSPLVEPRIEPEIMFSLARSPDPGMDEGALLSCVEWVGHGFEIVHSVFPGWRFKAADTIAAFGLHGALFVGPPEPIAHASALSWEERLASFEITLMRNGVPADHGRAAHVLGGGPLSALKHLVQLLAEDSENPPLTPGEIVSTGTLTRALPMAPGETWSTRLHGIPLNGIEITVR